MENNVTSKEWSFDSTLSSALDKTLSSSEYIDRMMHLLQPILDERFPNISAKQKIHKHIDRITFACPYCGDSMKSNYKKRGNFILTKKYAGHFKCHNCGEFKRVDKFFDDFKVNLELDTINYIAQSIHNFDQQSNAKYNLSLFLDLESIDNYAIDRQEFKQYFNLIEVDESPLWSWLKRRLQFDKLKFLYSKDENHIIILNLTQTGKILGIQKRLFKGTNKYLTYTLSKIYELMKKTEKIPEEIEAISQLFNICLVDFNRPVTLFEGAFDAFLFKNAIANAGIHKTFPLDAPLRYLYDSDEDGISESLKRINNDEYIFLWGKLKYDLELPYRKKWDFNDLMIYLKENKKQIPIFDHYFSNDSLDIIDL